MSAHDRFRLNDGTELTKEQLLAILSSPEAKEIAKKDREDRINAWCKETFEKLGTRNSLALFQPLFAFVEHIKWDVLNEEDQTLCKEAMERLLVIFDSEDQPLLSADGYDVINQELYNELGRTNMPNMTWKELADHIAKMPPERMMDNVSFKDDQGNFIPVNSFDVVEMDLESTLDMGHRFIWHDFFKE